MVGEDSPRKVAESKIPRVSPNGTGVAGREGAIANLASQDNCKIVNGKSPQVTVSGESGKPVSTEIGVPKSNNLRKIIYTCSICTWSGLTEKAFHLHKCEDYYGGK